MTNDNSPGIDTSARLVRRHLLFGWWALVGYLSLGMALEAMHGFKVAWYLDVGEETRRLLWTLAHAHGTLLAVVNLVFALSLPRIAEGGKRLLAIASPCLLAASLLLPGGFFLGGLYTYGGDPGLGTVLLTPLGAMLLFVAMLLTAVAATRALGRD